MEPRFFRLQMIGRVIVMMKKMLRQLKKMDAAEKMFGKEFIDLITFSEAKDAYIVRVGDYQSCKLEKVEGFKKSYFSLIAYLTMTKNESLNGCEPHNETSFYHDWLTFKIAYNVRKAWFYLAIKDTENKEEIKDLFVEILGKANYRAVEDLFHTAPEDFHEHGKIVMNYIGNTRAVRDLCMKYLDNEHGLSNNWAFHLWHMTAQALIEEYGYIFYLGNEMGSLEYCPYDYTAKEYYYNYFYQRILNNTMRDIPYNRHLTKEKKRCMLTQMYKEILGEDPDFSLDEFQDEA